MKKITLTGLKGFTYGNELRPVRDWVVLLAITLILLGFSIAWNLWTFSRVTAGDSVGSETAPEGTDTSAIDEAMRLFEERRTEEAKYRSEYRFVDPSLGAR